jgi:hypothetical protein
MKRSRWISAAVSTAALTVGFALPATAAFAAGGGNGNGNAGIASVLSGNTVNAPISAPINVCGVALGVLGFADAGCVGGASSATLIGGSGGGNGNGNAGIASVGSGNTVNVPVSAPINACGVAAGVLGGANAGCKGGSQSVTVVGSGNGGHNGNGGGNGNGNAGVASVLSGNTVNAPVSAPINICGVAAGVLGFANAGCEGGASSTTLINP